MAYRNTLVKEIEKYLWSIKTTASPDAYNYTVAYIVRNSRAEELVQFPALIINELEDMVREVPMLSGGGLAIIKKRTLSVAIEMWLSIGTTALGEGKATENILKFYDDVRNALFDGTSNGTLAGRCVLQEVEVSPIQKPVFGGDKRLIGLGVLISVIYVDNPQNTY